MKLPNVSIIIITKNEEQNIGDCLNSLMSLDYPKNKYEVLVIDSSIDQTREVAEKFPVYIILLDEPGFGIARNTGIKNANYEYVAFTDADCIVPRNWLRILIREFRDGVVAVGGNAFPPPDSPFIGKCIACLGHPQGGALGFEAIFKRIGDYIAAIGTCNAIFRKDVVVEVGGFNEDLVFGGEDVELCLRIRQQGYFIKYSKNSYVFHKTRNMRDFINWCLRRGYASRKSNWSEDNNIVMDRFYQFINILKYSVKRRSKINISIFTILFVLPIFFMIRELLMLFGRIYKL